MLYKEDTENGHRLPFLRMVDCFVIVSCCNHQLCHLNRSFAYLVTDCQEMYILVGYDETFICAFKNILCCNIFVGFVSVSSLSLKCPDLKVVYYDPVWLFGCDLDSYTVNGCVHKFFNS